MNIYNEIELYAAQWLRNLIDARELPLGHVEEKSITDLSPSELQNYTQVHLFAGIGGWPLALKLAGWPENLPVWTGSCPCQPFSVAGKKKGNKDERHLWPEMFRLIKECKPPVIFGEQVASPDGIDWMQAVQNDLEESGYEVGKLDLCAAGIGSPQIRQRIFWVAISKHLRCRGRGKKNGANKRIYQTEAERHCPSGGLEIAKHSGRKTRDKDQSWPGTAVSSGCWYSLEWLLCRDNKIRPTQPGLFPLAHGLPRSLGEGSSREQRMGLLAAKRSRIGQLKGYGNAIVPQVAAWFIGNVLEWINLRRIK